MFGFVCPTREKRVIIHSFIEIITYGKTGNFLIFCCCDFSASQKSTTRLDGQLKSVKEAKKKKETFNKII
jgi:hypothetical protein